MDGGPWIFPPFNFAKIGTTEFSVSVPISQCTRIGKTSDLSPLMEVSVLSQQRCTLFQRRGASRDLVPALRSLPCAMDVANPLTLPSSWRPLAELQSSLREVRILGRWNLLHLSTTEVRMFALIMYLCVCVRTCVCVCLCMRARV